MSSNFFLTSFIILVLPHLILFSRQAKKYVPLVVVQILLGIVLGPSILGRFHPKIYTALFSPELLKQFDTMGQFALVLLGFLIGLRVDTGELIGKQYKKYIAIGVSSVLTPFLMTLPIAFVLSYFLTGLMGQEANTLIFSLSIALSSSVTALPVLGAILIENGYINKVEGKLAILFASVNDIFLWILLIIIVGISGSQNTTFAAILRNMAMFAVFAFLLMKSLKPIIFRYLSHNRHEMKNTVLAFFIGGILFSGYMAELVGLQPILGAFFFGLIIPRHDVALFTDKIEAITSVVFVPYFLVLAGLRTIISIELSEIWIIFIAITVVSMVGNFVGIAVPSFRAGFKKDTSVLLGIFMQCKGLMEIVILNTFLSAQIISQTAYSGMILMAIFTTSLTQPLTVWYIGNSKNQKNSK